MGSPLPVLHTHAQGHGPQCVSHLFHAPLALAKAQVTVAPGSLVPGGPGQTSPTSGRVCSSPELPSSMSDYLVSEGHVR